MTTPIKMQHTYHEQVEISLKYEKGMNLSKDLEKVRIENDVITRGYLWPHK